MGAAAQAHPRAAARENSCAFALQRIRPIAVGAGSAAQNGHLYKSPNKEADGYQVADTGNCNSPLLSACLSDTSANRLINLGAKWNSQSQWPLMSRSWRRRIPASTKITMPSSHTAPATNSNGVLEKSLTYAIAKAARISPNAIRYASQNWARLERPRMLKICLLNLRRG